MLTVPHLGEKGALSAINVYRGKVRMRNGVDTAHDPHTWARA